MYTKWLNNLKKERGETSSWSQYWSQRDDVHGTGVGGSVAVMVVLLVVVVKMVVVLYGGGMMVKVVVVVVVMVEMLVMAWWWWWKWWWWWLATAMQIINNKMAMFHPPLTDTVSVLFELRVAYQNKLRKWLRRKVTMYLGQAPGVCCQHRLFGWGSLDRMLPFRQHHCQCLDNLLVQNARNGIMFLKTQLLECSKINHKVDLNHEYSLLSADNYVGARSLMRKLFFSYYCIL